MSNLTNSDTIPSVNINSDCALVFKLMHENGLNFLLVQADNKKILGVITESSLLNKVSKTSFKSKIKNIITKVRKVDCNYDLIKTVELIKKEEYLFIYENDNFYGVINKTDILWYLKKKENNA